MNRRTSKMIRNKAREIASSWKFTAYQRNEAGTRRLEPSCGRAIMQGLKKNYKAFMKKAVDPKRGVITSRRERSWTEIQAGKKKCKPDPRKRRRLERRAA